MKTHLHHSIFALLVAACFSLTAPSAKACDNSSHIQVHSCDQWFTSPSGRHVWSVAGIHMDTIPNKAGCDSVIYVNLSFSTRQKPAVTTLPGELICSGTGDRFQWILCTPGFPKIPNDTNSSFQPMMNGQYAVICYTNGCPDTSDCVSFALMGMDNMSDDRLTLYPNPASQIVYAETPEPMRIHLYAVDGKLLRSYPATLRTEIPTQNLPAGTYLIRAEGENSLYTRKLVVMH